MLIEDEYEINIYIDVFLDVNKTFISIIISERVYIFLSNQHGSDSWILEKRERERELEGKESCIG